MNIVERSRTLRPSTRKPTSKSYKVNTEIAGSGDTLLLTIRDENNPKAALGVFEFKGDELADRASIHFEAQKINGQWELRFSTVRPIAVKFGGENI